MVMDHDLIAYIERLEVLAKSLQKSTDFSFVVVNERSDLVSLKMPPPTFAYVRADGAYYLKYKYSAHLAATPFYSGVGDGWHNMNSPCPRMDRPIHIIHTQWLNGWNLDYYPDFIDTKTGNWEQEELLEVLGKHYGPPGLSYSPKLKPIVVTIDGTYTTADSKIYFIGLTRKLNTLCTIVINGHTYGIIDWDTENTYPVWLELSTDLISTDLTVGTISWPESNIVYSGTVTANHAENDTEIAIEGLTGPIDTSYIFSINEEAYEITNYSPQGEGELPTTITISPGLATALDMGDPWDMVRGQNKYNTDIEDLRPGDLIFRTQTWHGVIEGNHEEGSTEITVTGVDSEIADKWFSSHAIPLAGKERESGYAGSYLNIGDKKYPVIDHEPNIRSVNNYECTLENSPCYDASRFDAIWKPLGLPTTKLFLQSPLNEGVTDGQAFTITNKHWYVVSVESLGSEDTSVSFETPQFCEGHIRDCFNFYHISAGEVPARFEAILHVIASEEAFETIWEQKKVIPGDLLYHSLWHNWYQILPKYVNGEVSQETSFADFSRTLTVFDKAEFTNYLEDFDFNNLYVINLSHETQRWTRTLKTGFDTDGNITTTTWTRYKYRPAEFVYYAGSTEESVR